MIVPQVSWVIWMIITGIFQQADRYENPLIHGLGDIMLLIGLGWFFLYWGFYIYFLSRSK